MTLQLLTARGRLVLGDPPATGLACAYCGDPAQLVADSPARTIATCASCVEDALVVAAHLTDLHGA